MACTNTILAIFGSLDGRWVLLMTLGQSFTIRSVADESMIWSTLAGQRQKAIHLDPKSKSQRRTDALCSVE